jgi:LuxR family maltose regulon positive regulatory protein
MFVDEGAAMHDLLRDAQAQGIATDYVSSLLAAFESIPARTALTSKSRQTDLDYEPLSERELEVLRLMAEGASNREIAETLFISIGTVKKHSSNIFFKLDARSRTQAIVNARKYNIL